MEEMTDPETQVQQGSASSTTVRPTLSLSRCRTAPAPRRTSGLAKAATATRKKKKAVRKKVAKKTGARPINKQSAKSYAIDVLGKQSKGLTLNDLADRVLASGFKTNSENFAMSLYQSLHKDRKAGKTFNYNEKTGLWTLKK